MANSNQTTVNFQTISQWNNERGSKTSLKNILQNAGNHFQFSFGDESVAQVHVYLSYDSDSQDLSFQVILAEQDTKENTQAVAIASAGQAKQQLPKPANEVGSNPHFIDYATASQRVDDYMNDAKRNKWIDNLFDNNLDVVQAFVVDATDFEPGDVYDCYLGLKDANNSQEIDLIIYNTSDSVLVGVRDMTRPIPPYKPIGGLSRDKFGALDNI
ncbi:hypothetical protein BST97_15170 [Nonlabens spongiae]|uniref:Uncharacterized protein n=1 Tax=Nonlabens spongiae TaxID=331648 RepID=A0A1W6MNY1_9FLAO|nr:hypothetical protein [Nonlabens spongiae]ARN79216.1 hypothetical protein BST97_15170 [Nonlabens spongiae]